VGLLFIALAQGCAFFTMARRSESQNHFADEQTLLLNMVHYPEVGDQPSIRIEATECRQAANDKIKVSDKWRFAGLVLFWLSLLAFNVGCLLALQLLFLRGSESMGNHDSKIVDAGSVD
jgi:hypothetical protein